MRDPITFIDLKKALALLPDPETFPSSEISIPVPDSLKNETKVKQISQESATELFVHQLRFTKRMFFTPEKGTKKYWVLFYPIAFDKE